MGIPSYFRRILQINPACLKKQVSEVESLYFDFNCLIYRCVSKMRPYTQEVHDEWEAELLKEVVKVVKEIWNVAGKPKKVLLAVDGVVPLAKIRQQRVRRFKSAWLKKIGWDTNSITPGTKFMDSLTSVLKDVASRHVGWEVSGVREPGEGEHKVMKSIRAMKSEKLAVVYGLDADLILLSMLTSQETGTPIMLLREKQEFNKNAVVGLKQEYQFMDLCDFQSYLGIESYKEALNYVALMSLMGNDFLPHSLTHKLSEDGHDYVLSEFNLMKSSNTWLCDDGVNAEVFMIIMERWSRDEKDKLTYNIKKKREQAQRGVGKGMSEEEGLPLTWDVESQICDGTVLKDDWVDIYWSFIHPTANRAEICGEYRKGFCWILNYYCGLPVDENWVYPGWIPPLWSDLLKYKGSYTESFTCDAPSPEEQLAMVLPLESWGLVRDKKLKLLPIYAPHMWPRAFSFFSFGRKWLWECEARVPVLTAAKIRQYLREHI